MSKAIGIVYIGGPLVATLLVATIIQATTPIKPIDMIVEAIAKIVLTLMPLALIGFAGVAVYAFIQAQRG